MCATEAWLWHNEAGRLEFIEQGGIETFVLSNLEPKFVVVAGTLKNMMLYGKGKIKKAVRTRLMTSDIIKKVLDFIQNEEARITHHPLHEGEVNLTTPTDLFDFIATESQARCIKASLRRACASSLYVQRPQDLRSPTNVRFFRLFLLCRFPF
jgi:hypothetical protein